MNAASFLRAMLLALVLTPAFAGTALVAASDYAFEIVEPEVKQGDAAIITVRFVALRTREPVTDAVIFATRLDMAPDDMAAMTAKVEALPSVEPGLYRFKANLMMEGGWRFSLAAKVQGEAETVRGELILRAIP
jgi:hypothetical protein